LNCSEWVSVLEQVQAPLSNHHKLPAAT